MHNTIRCCSADFNLARSLLIQSTFDPNRSNVAVKLLVQFVSKFAFHHVHIVHSMEHAANFSDLALHQLKGNNCLLTFYQHHTPTQPRSTTHYVAL